MNEILARQLALDYCLSPEEVTDQNNHFTVYEPREGRRLFQMDQELYLKICIVNGKILFSGRPDILQWCREQYEDSGAEWFFEPKNLRKMNARFLQDGYQIETAHPFYIGPEITPVDTAGWDLRWFEQEEILQFKDDPRFDEAYAFDPAAPDMLGVSAVEEGEYLGTAGASADSDTMWQIGIIVDEKRRKKGLGTLLTTVLKNEVLKRGKLPFYGHSMAHIASQRVGLGAGFIPSWWELATSKIENQ